jgi:hypothetical protein
VLTTLEWYSFSNVALPKSINLISVFLRIDFDRAFARRGPDSLESFDTSRMFSGFKSV